jgi:ectoine hydroxylase-related dioxygenase (phytanoyl-CoA dioxygenase family)
MATTAPGLSAEQQRVFREQGFLVVPRLIGQDEVGPLLDNFMQLHEERRAGKIANEASGDPTQEYPRLMQPHRVNSLALRYLLDPRIAAILRDLFGEEPLAAQSMFYFKPAGGPGQGLHQDNFFLRVEPGTCIAAWMALDPVDRENGGLHVVPGTHEMDIFCPEPGFELAFSRDTVPVPPGLSLVPVDLDPGDVLFFNGCLVHGSPPNTSRDRFRRTFICHYVGRSSERISHYYPPILTMSGDVVSVAETDDGGPCGVFWKGGAF